MLIKNANVSCAHIKLFVQFHELLCPYAEFNMISLWWFNYFGNFVFLSLETFYLRDPWELNNDTWRESYVKLSYLPACPIFVALCCGDKLNNDTCALLCSYKLFVLCSMHAGYVLVHVPSSYIWVQAHDKHPNWRNKQSMVGNLFYLPN